MLNDYEKSVLMSTAEAMLANRCGMFERFKQDVEMRRHDWFFNALDIAEFKMVFMRNNTLVLHAHPQTADDETIEAAAKVVAKWARNQPSPYVPKPLPPVVPASPAPVVADSVSNAPAWTVIKPLRYNGYTAPLHRLIAAAHRDGKPCPTARDVVEAWRNNAPAEIAKVLPDGFDYYDTKGDTKTADLEAIRKAIGRMTSAR